MSEPNNPHALAEFTGSVACTRNCAATLTLCGAASGVRAERLILTFVGADNAQIPATLAGARVSTADGQTYLLESPPQQWTIHAHALHVHRDVRSAFFAAVPPRRAPLGKRLFWRAVLGLAAYRYGLRLLVALRGR